MRKFFFTSLLIILPLLFAIGQKKTVRVITTDVENFWVAYDSMRTTTDSLQQLRYLQTLYLDKGTPGLKALREVRNYKPEEWVSAVRRYPKFWDSLRPHTLKAKAGADGLEPHLKKLQKLYPALRPAKIYFSIGVFRTSGTTQDSLVLIGAELVTGNASVDISEFPQNLQTFLARYYKSDPFQNMIPLNVHEYVHTQQKGMGSNLLGRSIFEGACDFISELVTGKKVPLPYMEYGPRHEEELKEKFKADMYAEWTGNWFYNQTDAHPDLGYYMGYAICKAYYQQAKNKKQAIKEIIELDYNNTAAVEAFLATSKFYKEPLDKTQLLQAYASASPTITAILPFTGPDSVIDASVKELRVEFSAPMAIYHSTDYGTGGKDQWPIVGRAGFSEDKKAFTYKVALKPDQEYSFVITGGGFRAATGHPLKSYEVRFRTKKE